MTTPAAIPVKSTTRVAIVKAWLIAGTLDMLAAVGVAFVKGYSPVLIFRYIASAAFGRDSAATGWSMVVASLVFHYCIALIWTLIFYYIVYPLVHSMIRSAVVAGLLYGVIVWCVMNLLVVPASRVAAKPLVLSSVLRQMIILMLCIGLHRYNHISNPQ